jgi:hypothetical protein
MKSINQAMLASMMMAAGLMHSAVAADQPDGGQGANKAADIPHCEHVLGTITLADGDGRGWAAYGLGPPAPLLDTFVSQSGCFTLVDQGGDWLLVGDVTSQRQSSVSIGIGGIAGGLFHGRLGGAAGAVTTGDIKAHVVLSLINQSTSKEEHNVKGYAKKNDTSFSGGGFVAWGHGAVGVGGSTYQNTDSGKVVGLAFLNAYRQLVTEMGGLTANQIADGALQPFVTRASTVMRSSPSDDASAARTLAPGAVVYPTGDKEGTWSEVQDDSGAMGWVSGDQLEPKK